jgi:hypothetical protein
VDSCSERVVTVVLCHVCKRQHGNRSFKRAAHVTFYKKKFVCDKIGKSKAEDQYDDSVCRAAIFIGRALATGVPLYSGRSQLKRPGKNNGDRETHGQQQKDGPLKPGGKLKYRSYSGCNLQQQPCGCEVNDGNLENAASLQFGKKRNGGPR